MKKIIFTMSILWLASCSGGGDDQEQSADEDKRPASSEACETDADCPTTNICVNGRCVWAGDDDDATIPVDDDSTAPADDDSLPTDDDVTSADDDVTAADDDITPVDDDISPTDDDSTLPDDDVTEDDDSTPIDDDTVPPDDDTVLPDDDTTPLDDDSTALDDDSTPADDDSTITDDDSTGVPPNLEKGELIGSMWNTYYYFADEADYSGSDDTTLYDDSCNPIAEVPADYSDDVCIEGSGILEDGTVINYADSCSCGRNCPTGGKICYVVLDPAEFPWGMGSKGNPLFPLRSWAVDNDIIPFGTILYAEEWDGVPIPLIDGIGGFTHDGCFRADDVGGAIQDNHYDFFAGTADMWQELEDIFPTSSDFTVYRDAPRCAHLAP
jgi:3D (Asp-Asp-Asp) domain-containing protein